MLKQIKRLLLDNRLSDFERTLVVAIKDNFDNKNLSSSDKDCLEALIEAYPEQK